MARRSKEESNGEETALTTRQEVPAELKPFVDGDYEVIQTGGITKWIDLELMKEGDMIEGVLLGAQTIEDPKDDSLRYFYNIRLLRDCPVSYKNEEGEAMEEFAKAGEVVSLGERSKLAFLRDMCDDGGVYQLLIKPDKKIKIKGGRSVWTFYVGKKVLRPPMRVRAEVMPKRTPF